MIISKLMHAFLSRAAPSSTNSDQLLQKVSGQALAMLTIESADNCSAILKESGYVIRELASMICEDGCRYVAASLLQNLFLHIQPELSNSDLTGLSDL